MKYSAQRPPLQCFMTHSTCYQQTSPMTVKGILFHSTGANNPWLKRYVQPYEGEPNYNEMIALLGKNRYNNDWNHTRKTAGLNAWIGKLEDGSVATVQTMNWDWRPWGCGSGAKGSCNDGWIQFEICEDGLTDEKYFMEVYTEACELAAYLCQLYNINPHGTVVQNGVVVPTILCHNDSYKLKLGSGHADITHWFPKFGKSMETVREDVSKLLNTKPAPAPTPVLPTELYRIRKSWEDKASQKGAYRDLTKAKAACDAAGPEYNVYNQQGELIYPEKIEPATFKVGDVIQIMPGAKYVSGATIPNWVIKSTLYLREIRKNGDIVFSTLKTGAITGTVNPQYIVGYQSNTYNVKITTAALNVRSTPSTIGGKLGIVKQDSVHTILEEKNGWGKIKFQGVEAWISLTYTQKV